MVNFRAVIDRGKRQWSIFRRKVDEHYDADYFRALDLILTGGGYQVNCDNPWLNRYLILHRSLGVFQFCMAWAKLWSDYHNQKDPLVLFGATMIVVALVICYFKVFMIEYYFTVYQESRKFINSNNSDSEDSEYDTSVRRYVARKFRYIIFLLIFILSCDQVILHIPNSTRDRVFGLPSLFDGLGPIARSVVQFLYIWGLTMFWGCRFFVPSLLTSALLMGLRSELLIVAHAYETIESRVQARVSSELNGTKPGPSSNCKIEPNSLMWKHLKQILGTTLEQHVELLRHVQMVQAMVSNVFALVYYCAIYLVAMLVLLIIRGGFIPISILFASCAMTYALECYLWCHLIESFEEIMEEITNSVYSLAAELPYELKHRSEFVRMRKSLLIIHMNTSRSGLFSCAGIFTISNATFWNFCDIIYTLITFLLNVQ